MIGVIIAVKDEIESLIKRKYSDHFIHVINKRKYYMVKTNSGSYVPITFSGIGKVNASHAAANIISDFKVNKIINIGSAASMSNDLNLRDIVLVDKLQYFDVDMTGFNSELTTNQIPDLPLIFETNKLLNQEANKILKASELKYYKGKCYTGEFYITKTNLHSFDIKQANVETYVIDKEATAIAQICFKNSVKFVCIKIVIDKLDGSECDKTKISKIIDSLSYNLIEAIAYNDSK